LVVLLAGIVVVGIYQSRYEYDEPDGVDFSQKSMLMGFGSGQILLGVGFLGQLLVYSMRAENTDDMSKPLLQVILLILTVSSWWYFAFIQMDYNDDKHAYGNKIDGLRQVTRFMSYVFTGLVIGISTLSYKGMMMNNDEKNQYWKTMTRHVAVASSILFFVFYIVDMHSINTTGGSHNADGDRAGGALDDKYFGEVGINKLLIIGQCITAVLAAVAFAVEAVLCFIDLKMETIYNACKYTLACAGFVFVSLGSIYGAHQEFGTQRNLPAYSIMTAIGIQFFAYAMIFFALNSTNVTMGGFMALDKSRHSKGMYY